MFGYITADRAELKGKELDRYRAFYCGVCRDLRDSCGESARLTLTYDMTFLGILLTGLYEGETELQECRCLLHPGKEHKMIRNAYTAYAADMNLILVYHNLMDDWEDEHKAASYAAARALRGTYLKTVAKYPRQNKAVRRYLKALHEIERRNDRSIDKASGETGKLMAEIFVMKEDVWSEDLRELGFYLGKFIYLMDAWDDLEKDKKSGNYNPFLELSEDEDYENEAGQILTMQVAAATRAFERLPIIEEVDILRNILYSGIWVKYRTKVMERGKKQDDRSL